MKAAAFLISLIALPIALPAQAKDSDDVRSWSLDELCEKKDKRRHAEAVFVEFVRREIFTATDLARVRWGYFGVGMGEAALQCLWGAPDSKIQGDGAASKTYRNRIDGEWRTIDVYFVQGRVTDIRMRPVEYPPWTGDPSRTFSDEIFWSGLNSGNRFH